MIGMLVKDIGENYIGTDMKEAGMFKDLVKK
ncbi:MAG: hypothetical protein DDT19_01575 [Syntrophomonadaceae bacterium]|nr:hypothetical protein [Bacillota bacterium]